jgi:segregation and condensation protein B
VRDAALARIEAALMMVDQPITARKLVAVASLADTTEVRTLIDRLNHLYDQDGTAFSVVEIAGGYQLLTRPAYRPWLVRSNRTDHELRLTPAVMETLAVIAYRQPITRADIEGIRGVSCADLITQLIEKNLIKIAGRHESLGRPVLYATTKKFLVSFGLDSLKDLPEHQRLSTKKGKE